MQTRNGADAMNRPERVRPCPAAPSLWAELTGELLRTPAFRALLKTHLAAGQDTVEADVEALFWEDVDLTMGLARRAVETANTLARTLSALARQVDKMPEALLDEMIQGLWSDLDRQAFQDALAAWRRVVERLAKREPAMPAGLVDLASSGLRAGVAWTSALIERQPGLARPLLELAIQIARTALRDQLAGVRWPFLSRP
jgi:hypothetical protein